MLSYALSTASAYFHLPIDEEEDADIDSYQRKFLPWATDCLASSSSSIQVNEVSPTAYMNNERNLTVLEQVLASDDLYDILGVPKLATLDRMMLRRAYLSRSKACHPDKFPGNPGATCAFQKVAIAYDILSKPSSKRLYDSRSPTSVYDPFSSRPGVHAEDTLKGVVLGAFNDFIDGDLEVIRTLLESVDAASPSLRLGNEGITSILKTLHAIRERALTCRICMHALHAEIARLLEVKTAFQGLSYFDIMGRSRLTIQLTRITITLPIAIEKALREEGYSQEPNSPDVEPGHLFPRHVTLFIRAADFILERMERILR
ncbi:hypothetical protein M378DRAFT_159302 [Amanita muscaria Koide BX008]|uniref:J domain-containing protein n=1 Tax=Amanita muscaria (strain Koide BX008) TaxID=946122 RepID=A0A0C2SVN6_AMAMK|nr:hypothetical protein M378DRAFT_159302 [Amanita muscaria Koide BX008]